MNGKAYIYKATGHFAFISDSAKEREDIEEVNSLPPNAQSRWNGSSWVALTDAEIATEEPADGELDQNVEFPITVIKNSVPLWGDENAAKLIGSSITLSENTLNIPYNVNLVGEYQFFINSNSINTSKDRQRAVETTEDSHGLNSWELLLGMSLKSANTSTSLYKIEVQLILHADTDNSQFVIALFVNGEQQLDSTVTLNFKYANDSKSVNLSQDSDLEPGSIVSLYWKGSGEVTCHSTRRKLSITQYEGESTPVPTEPTTEPPTEPEPTNWVFLGDTGINLTHGSSGTKDVLYRSGMSLVRDSEGMYFTGESPYKSWARLDFLGWRRGENKTLKIVFAAEGGNSIVGVGSDDIQKTAGSYFFQAELAANVNSRTFISLNGNNGIVWKGVKTNVNKRVTSNYHRLEIENDGVPGSTVRFYELPNLASDHWDSTEELLYEGTVGEGHTADAKFLAPFCVPNDGAEFKIAAVWVV